MKRTALLHAELSHAIATLGHGDMLFLPPGASKPTRAQGTFIDDKEVRESVKLVKNLAEQQFEPELVQIKSANLEGDGHERDPLFDEAVRIVLETKRGSVSLLQRRLTIEETPVHGARSMLYKVLLAHTS